MHARIDHEFHGPAACLLDPEFHCSSVSAESGKSSGCWLKQHADDAMSNQAAVRDKVQTVVQAPWSRSFRSSPTPRLDNGK